MSKLRGRFANRPSVLFTPEGLRGAHGGVVRYHSRLHHELRRMGLRAWMLNQAQQSDWVNRTIPLPARRLQRVSTAAAQVIASVCPGWPDIWHPTWYPRIRPVSYRSSAITMHDLA